RNIHCLSCATADGRSRPGAEEAHMGDEVIFYSSPFSRGRIVHWMLEEAGAPYRFEVVNLETKEQKRPEYLAVNPMGKVPTIVHRGAVVTECAAICAYLADAFPAARLAPPTDSPARGTYYRWLFFGGCSFEPAIIDRMLSRPPASRPGALSYGCYEDAVETLAKALTPGPYILGRPFSAADVSVCSPLTCLVALIPVVSLLVMLAVFRVPAWLATLLGSLITFALAAWVWRMPLDDGTHAYLYGAATGVWNVDWITLWGMVLFNTMSVTGLFENFRRWLIALGGMDVRVQTMLFAWAFGALLEGLVGFGSPWAVVA